MTDLKEKRSARHAGVNAIFVLELVAAWLCCQLLALKFACKGKQAFLFIDNSASISSLRKGASIAR